MFVALLRYVVRGAVFAYFACENQLIERLSFFWWRLRCCRWCGDGWDCGLEAPMLSVQGFVGGEIGGYGGSYRWRELVLAD